MEPEVPAAGEALDALIHALHATHGLDISVYDQSFLRNTIDKQLTATGLKTVAAYAGRLAERRPEAETFYRSLRIGYSEFFRDPLAFALLEQTVLPELAAAKKQSGMGELRVWSAGCAAGQEVWSLAMLLDELTTAGERPLPYRIFATDVSEADLLLARAGQYNDAELGNVRSRHLRRCFARHGRSFTIVPRLRARVDFSAYDLLDKRSSSPQASIYGGFDLILCCNLLLYYKAQDRRSILDKLCGTLSPGGYLVTGGSEREIVAGHAGLGAVAAPAAVFRKRGKTT